MWKTICGKYSKASISSITKVVYGVFLLGIFIVTLWVFIDSPKQGHFREMDNNDVWFGDHWSYADRDASVETQNGQYMKITAFGGRANITKTIDRTPSAEEYFCFRVKAQEIFIYVNGEALYEKTYKDRYWEYAKQLYLLHQVPMDGVRKGDILTIEIRSEGAKFFNMQFPAIGDRYALVRFMLLKSRSSLFVCLAALIIIILILATRHSPILTEKLHDVKSLHWLTVFLFLSVIYISTDSGCMEIFVEKTGIINWLNGISQMLLPIPLILFTKSAFFPGHKRYEALVFLNFALAVVSILSYIILADSMTDFFPQLHFLIIAGIIECIISFVQEKTVFSVEVVIGFAGILAGTAATIVTYWSGIAEPASVFFGYGILVFSACMLVWIVRSRYELERLRSDAEHVLMERDMKAAEKANEQKSRFLSHMSHEIRTPLNAILGMNQLIMREAVNENVKKYSNNIQNAGNTLLGIINDVLDFSKIETGKIDIIPSEYSLSVLLNDIVVMIQGRAEGKGLELQVEVDNNIPDSLFGDEIRVKQVIINLMTNAVKYTKEGWIKISVGMRAVSHYLDDDNLVLIVSVSDSGMGIKEEEKDKLFKEFERLDRQKTKNIEGTGLGLSITAQLVTLMDGKISVDSVYGEGSVFTVEIPQRITKYDPIGDYKRRFETLSNEKKKEQENNFENLQFAGKRVFVADDNEMNLDVIVSLLELLGLEVEKAGGGQEAIDCLDKEKFDLILTDDMMPEIGGKQVMRHIHETPGSANHNTPIVVLTANAVVGAREEYIALGFDDYMTKPIDIDVLQKILIKYLK